MISISNIDDDHITLPVDEEIAHHYECVGNDDGKKFVFD